MKRAVDAPYGGLGPGSCHRIPPAFARTSVASRDSFPFPPIGGKVDASVERTPRRHSRARMLAPAALLAALFAAAAPAEAAPRVLSVDLDPAAVAGRTA